MLLFAQNLEYLLSSKNVTLHTLAQYVGVSHSSIGNWKNGDKHPDIKSLVMICKYFGIDPSDILLKDLTTGITPEELKTALPGNISGKNLLIPAGAQSGYLQEEWTADYVRSLSMLAIPGVEGEARTFEIVENTMIPDLAPGEYVACTASSLAEVQSGHVYVIVTSASLSDRGQIHIGYAQVEKDRVLCIPENKEEFDPYHIPVAKIREVWEAKMKISPKVTDPLAGGYHPSRLRNLEEFLRGKFPDMVAE